MYLQSLRTATRCANSTEKSPGGFVTRSGLKSWHKFALLVWNYPESATLPPKKPAHVISYVTIFSNTGTAYNYVGHIKRGCIYKNYPIEWYTDEVTMALSGLKKTCLKWYGGPTRTKFLMTSKMVQMIVGYNTPNGKVQFARCLQLSWQFLLRLKSEAMVVWKGEPADLGKLPFNRDNSIWVDEQKTLHLKLRKRKNRPWGSNLQATCQCKTRPGECIPCIFYTWLLNFEVGQVVWTFKTHQFQETMRRHLGILGFSNGARLWTFKSVRAGKATELAKTGSTLPAILTAAEWENPRSFLSYCNTDDLDHGGFLSAAMDASDSESEDEIDEAK